TFAFARGAKGLSAERSDYVDFANQLIEGGGEAIVVAWEVLQATDAPRMKAAADRLVKLRGTDLKPGRLKGLLFGDPGRFIDDLVSQLHMAATLSTLKAALDAGNGRITKNAVGKFEAFIAAVDDWHGRHGYNSY